MAPEVVKGGDAGHDFVSVIEEGVILEIIFLDCRLVESRCFNI